MLRRPTQYSDSYFSRRHSLFCLATCCALIFVSGGYNLAIGQVPSALRPSESAEETKDKPAEPTLQQWRADVQQRLAVAEMQATEAKQEERELSAALKRHLDILSRIDLLLAQLADERDETKKLEDEREKLKEELDQLVQQGLEDSGAATFQQLDQVREELRSEQRRLKRLIDKEKAAVLSLEKAQEDRKEEDAQRRLAKEKSEDNRDDALRQRLGEELAEAIDESELAKAITSLRGQEVRNAKIATESQEIQVRVLEETEARLNVVVKFGPQELAELFEELDSQEDELKKRIDKFDSAAEPRIRYVEEQWIAARRKLDATTGDKSELQATIRAFELEYRVLREIPPLLRLQIDLLNRDRQAWRYRQRVFGGQPDRKSVLEWSDETTDALAQIRREERKTIFEIDELREQVKLVEERRDEAEKESLEADAIDKQLASLQGLLEFQEESLTGIRKSLRLHERLLGELEGDSLTATAKDQLHNLWNGVLAIWNYELTSFGEGDNERAVTVQKVVTAVLVLLAGIVLSRALSRALGRQVLRRLDIDPSASATIQSLFYYVLLLLFSLFALNVAKVPLTAFTVLGGAVALGIGFGSQNIINNFISGLILLAERPVKVGDLIQLDTPQGTTPLYGNIEHIGARSTRVRTGSNLEIIVPNSSFLQNNVVNFTLSSDKVRTMVEVGVIYGSPTVTVTQLLRRAVIETGRVAKDPPPIILFKSFGDSALVFEVHFWLRMRTMMDQMQIESAVRFRIDQLFREEGITIAFPQRDVHLDASSPLSIQMIENSASSST